MRTDILEFCLNQLSAIILFTVFCVCGIRLRRFSAKVTLLAGGRFFCDSAAPDHVSFLLFAVG